MSKCVCLAPQSGSSGRSYTGICARNVGPHVWHVKCMPCTRVSCMLGMSWSCHGSPYSGALQNDSIGGQPRPSAHPLRILAALFSDVPCSESPFPSLGQNPSRGRSPGGNSDSKADTLHVNRPIWVLTSSPPSLIIGEKDTKEGQCPPGFCVVLLPEVGLVSSVPGGSGLVYSLFPSCLLGARPHAWSFHSY